MGKIKGTTLVKTLKSLRARRHEALALLPEELHHYLNERILATTWHEEEDYLGLMRVLAQLLPPPDEPGLSIWEFMGRVSAREDFEDLYASLIKPGDPAASLKSFETHWRLRHDSGQVAIEFRGPAKATVEIRDYALVASEICSAVQGTIWQILHAGRAEGIALEKELCRGRGDGLCRWQASWTAPTQKTPAD